MGKTKLTNRIYARQGDVAILYAEGIDTAGWKPVPRERGGVVLAHGEVTGHMHELRAQGVRLLAMPDNPVTGEAAMQAIARLGGGLTLGDRVLEVSKPATLRHDEHGPIKHAPGQFIVRQQREYQRGRIRNVAD